MQQIGFAAPAFLLSTGCCFPFFPLLALPPDGRQCHDVQLFDILLDTPCLLDRIGGVFDAHEPQEIAPAPQRQAEERPRAGRAPLLVVDKDAAIRVALDLQRRTSGGRLAEGRRSPLDRTGIEKAQQLRIESVEIVLVVLRAILALDGGDVRRQIVGKLGEPAQHHGDDVLALVEGIGQLDAHPVLVAVERGVERAVEGLPIENQDEVRALVDTPQQCSVEVARTERIDIETDTVTVARQQVEKMFRGLEAASAAVAQENVVSVGIHRSAYTVCQTGIKVAKKIRSGKRIARTNRYAATGKRRLSPHPSRQAPDRITPESESGSSTAPYPARRGKARRSGRPSAHRRIRPDRRPY